MSPLMAAEPCLFQISTPKRRARFQTDKKRLQQLQLHYSTIYTGKLWVVAENSHFFDTLALEWLVWHHQKQNATPQSIRQGHLMGQLISPIALLSARYTMTMVVLCTPCNLIWMQDPVKDTQSHTPILLLYVLLLLSIHLPTTVLTAYPVTGFITHKLR